MQNSRNKIKSSLIAMALYSGLAISSQAHASLVTVSGEFLEFTPSLVADNSASVITSYSATSGLPPVTTVLSSYQPTALTSGTNKVDFTFVQSEPSFLHNTFEFTSGQPADVVKGDVFKLGTFTYTNGSWFDTTKLTFKLTTHSSDVALDNHVFDGTLNLVTNGNTVGDPYSSADYFYIMERPDLGSVRVFDKLYQPAGNPGYVGSVDFYGRIGSLIPTSFANPNAATFLSSSVNSSISPVPEPSSWLMMLSGIAGLLFWKRLSNNRVSGNQPA